MSLRISTDSEPDLQDDLLLDRRGAETAADPNHGLVVVGVEVDRVDAVDLGDVAPVVLVDVPGVPEVRDVAVQLQPVTHRAGGDRLPPGRVVGQRGDLPALADHHPDDAVVQMDVGSDAVGLHGLHRRDRHPGRPTVPRRSGRAGRRSATRLRLPAPTSRRHR